MDDDDQPRGKGEVAVSSENAMGPIYMMWENSLEKLKLLNYELDYCKKLSKRPFNRVQFSQPLPANANLGNLFDDFTSICAWLVAIIVGNNNALKYEQFDDPNIKVNKLMVALNKSVGFPGSKDFTAQKLRTANGESVCFVLDFLTDKALAARGFQFGPALYPAQDEIEQVQGEEDEDEDIIEEEAAGGTGDEELLYEENSRLETSMDNSTLTILQPQIDPLEWKTELERVGPKLSATVIVMGNEWRAHVDQSMRGKEQITKLMGTNKGDLHALNKQVSEELNQMRMKEKYLNNQYNTVCLEYVEVKHKLEELEKKSSATNEVVSKLTGELAEVSERLDDMKESFDSKDSGMNDTSPLVRIKGALQQLKEEIHSYDMRIGVVSNSLLLARVSDHTRVRAKAMTAAKRRGNKNRRSSGADDRSVNSDDN